MGGLDVDFDVLNPKGARSLIAGSYAASKKGSTTLKNSSGLDENTTFPASKTSSRDPGMYFGVVDLTSGGKLGN